MEKKRRERLWYSFDLRMKGICFIKPNDKIEKMIDTKKIGMAIVNDAFLEKKQQC